VVAAGEAVLRAGISGVLSLADSPLVVLREASSVEETCEAVRRLEPDVVLAGGSLMLEAIARLSSLRPAQAIVAIVRSHDVAAVDEALRAGATACAEIHADSASLAAVVAEAASGRTVIPRRTEWGSGTALRLSAREQQVLGLVEEGLTDRSIAMRLGVSVKTVEKHVGSLLRKTGARSRVEVLAMSLQQGRI
jgi:DNA-binding NarL/FixJ family response regulator